MVAFRKNTWKQIGAKGCAAQYNNCQKFQNLVSMMCALAFVPVDEIIQLWCDVIEPEMYRMEDELTAEMDDYIDYFIDTYLGKVGRNGRRGKPRIKHELWNVFSNVLEKIPTTNNMVEAWNGAWNKSTPTNASLWTIISGFQREEGLVRQKVHDDQLLRVDVEEDSLAGNSRRIHSKDKVARVRNICMEYGEREDKREYLIDVANIVYI